jgi:hypothetical protein
MPIMQSEPFEKHDGKEKSEPKNRGGAYQREEVRDLHLITRVDDGISETAYADAR